MGLITKKVIKSVSITTSNRRSPPKSSPPQFKKSPPKKSPPQLPKKSPPKKSPPQLSKKSPPKKSPPQIKKTVKLVFVKPKKPRKKRPIHR